MKAHRNGLVVTAIVLCTASILAFAQRKPEQKVTVPPAPQMIYTQAQVDELLKAYIELEDKLKEAEEGKNRCEMFIWKRGDDSSQIFFFSGGGNPEAWDRSTKS